MLRKRIVTAEYSDSSNLAGHEIGELIATMSKLAAELYPVTTETLRACREGVYSAIRFCMTVAIILGLALLPSSMVSGISLGLTENSNDQLGVANQLLIDLHNKSLTPVLQVGALQQYFLYCTS